MLARLLAVPLSLRLHAETMLFIDVIGALGASFVMLAFSTQSTAMHTMTAVYGLSMASIFPSAFTVAEGYIEVGGLTWVATH
jgi:hypothetical protein